MTNKYRDHVIVIPEDDANRLIVNGFLLDPMIRSNSIHVQRAAGGWARTVDIYRNDVQATLATYPLRHIVLVIDFDDQTSRAADILGDVGEAVRDRVFVIGVLSEAEKLRTSLGRPLEHIGKSLASECREGTNSVWGHELLRHNTAEIARLRRHVRPFLFD